MQKILVYLKLKLSGVPVCSFVEVGDFVVVLQQVVQYPMAIPYQDGKLMMAHPIEPERIKVENMAIRYQPKLLYMDVKPRDKC